MDTENEIKTLENILKSEPTTEEKISDHPDDIPTTDLEALNLTTDKESSIAAELSELGEDLTAQTMETSGETELLDLGALNLEPEVEAVHELDFKEEFLADEEALSIIESLLFLSDKPIGFTQVCHVFENSQFDKKQIRELMDQFIESYNDSSRGLEVFEIDGGYQLRTKEENKKYLQKTQTQKSFKLTGATLEALSIIAYKQPCIKSDVDEIRGVDSGHLMRTLMDKGLVSFAGKSELPGKPMLYKTTKKFLQIFGLRNLKELPSLSEIDELLPEGIGSEEEKEILGDVTDQLSVHLQDNVYSAHEEEHDKIQDQLSQINTSSEFFEMEKASHKAERDATKAREIREAQELGQDVSDKDSKWLQKYEARQLEPDLDDIGSEATAPLL